MAEYKRWMAYLYSYENGFKKNCIGTARIERRGEEARTTVSIQIPGMSNEILQAFYYVRTTEGIRGVEAGTIKMNGSAGNSRMDMNADNMGGTGLRLEQMDGFLICRDGARYYASAWDECPVLPTEVHMLLSEEEKETQQEGNRETEEEIADDSAEEVRENTAELTAAEEALPESRVHTAGTAADRIFESCPVVWPFTNPWAECCVKLELEDIGLLPVRLWNLTANSFLMHSYYGYRHLVLARSRDGGRYRYELLVPGIYNDRERELAELFGFRNFHCAKSRPVSTGEFGYWSMEVEWD